VSVWTGKVSTTVKPLDPQTILSKNSRLLSKFTAKKLNSSGPQQSLAYSLGSSLPANYSNSQTTASNINLGSR
jgi:hypothetical protein